MRVVCGLSPVSRVLYMRSSRACDEHVSWFAITDELERHFIRTHCGEDVHSRMRTHRNVRSCTTTCADDSALHAGKDLAVSPSDLAERLERIRRFIRQLETRCRMPSPFGSGVTVRTSQITWAGVTRYPAPLRTSRRIQHANSKDGTSCRSCSIPRDARKGVPGLSSLHRNNEARSSDGSASMVPCEIQKNNDFAISQALMAPRVRLERGRRPDLRLVHRGYVRTPQAPRVRTERAPET